MQKIISLFQRNYDGDRLVRDEVVPGAQWVVAGEGVATRKYDGTCCLVRGGKLFKRYDAKNGKTPPPGFEPAQDPDPVSGHWPGWLPIGKGPEDRWHVDAQWNAFNKGPLPDGTYELVGPSVNGNPDNFTHHTLVPHGQDLLDDCPRTFDAIKAYLTEHPIEGIVWRHPDGRMVKIKARDFGFAWGNRAKR
jgi:hypothetical protein